MLLNALLDVDLVAVEAEDRISVLLELTAPVRGAAERRPRASLQIVLDRSGSMAGPRLDAAISALEGLVGRLEPADDFGVVVFDQGVQVVVPAGPLHDPTEVRKAIRGIGPGGTTNLSGGLFRGVQEARRVAGSRGATVVVISDGHANEGVTAAAALERAAAEARGAGVTVSSVGVGLGYDEELMAGIARGGAGNHHFAEEADAAGAAIVSEAEGLLATVAQAANLTVRPGPSAASATLYNDLPAVAIEGGFMVELGDFHSGEVRRVLLEVELPALSSLGLARACELELRWVDPSSLDAHTVELPVSVNVVLGDQAAGRVPDPKVRTERAFQAAQRAKREAIDALRRGEHESARQRLDAAGHELQAAALGAPADMAAEMAEEASLLEALAARAAEDRSGRVEKWVEADRHLKARKRGRPPGGEKSV